MTLAPAEQRTRPSTLPDVPFPGLKVFSAEYAPFFFGRDGDRKVIVSNLEAAQLTLLYGASGVGKSSVLQAGVVRALRVRSFENLELVRKRREEGDDRPHVAKFAIAEFHSWVDDPLPPLMEHIRLAAMEALGGEQLTPWQPGEDVVATLRTWTKRVRFIYVVLDQFEEYFLYHPPSSEPGSFDVELARLVNEPGLHVHVLLSLREDALALLDRFKPTIPRLYDNYLRIDHLDLKAAEQAIRGPIAAYNELRGGEVSVDDALVRDLLASPELRTHRALGSGATVVPAAEDGAQPRLETPYLQLVLSHLWDAERKRNSSRLCAATLAGLGGPRQIVKAYFDEAISALSPEEQETAVEIFHHLVTPSKSKIAHTVADLADYTNLDESDVAAVLTKLSADHDNRILNRTIAPPDPESPKTEDQRARYEIWHDVLAEPILAWREKKLAERHEDEERKAREQALQRRIRRLAFVAACVVAALVAAGAVVSVVLYLRALSAQHASRSQQLAAAALAQAESDPSSALGTALHALRVHRTPAAENALLTILPESRLRSIVPARSWVTAAALGGPNGRYVALGSSDGDVRVWDWRTKRELARLQHVGSINAVQFANGGKRLLTVGGTKESTVKVWNLDDCMGKPICHRGPDFTGGSAFAAISDDGRWMIDAGGRTVYLWNVDSCRVGSCKPRTADTPSTVVGVATSRNGFVAAASDNGTVTEWSRSHGRLHIAHRFGTPWADVQGVAISPNSKLLAAFGDKGVIVWDLTGCVPSTDCTTVLKARVPDWVQAVAFSPDSASLATASEDGVARVWNLLQPTPPLQLPGLHGIVFSIGFSPDGRYLVTGGNDAEARIWNVAPGTVVARASAWITGAEFSPSGKRILVGTSNGSLTVRDTHGRIMETLRPKLGNGRHRAVAGVFVGNGTAFAGATDGATGRWDLRSCRGAVCTGKSVTREKLNGGFAVNDTGTLFAGNDNKAYAVKIVAVRTHHVVATIENHGQIMSLAFNPRAPLLAMASANGAVYVWDVAQCLHARKCTPWLVRTIRVPSPLLGIAFSPDGGRLAVGSSDGIGRVFDLRNASLQPLQLIGHTSNIGTIAFSADGRRIATGGADTTIRIWDARTARLLGIIRGHTDRVDVVEFDPHDSSKVLSASDDGTATISKCTTCAPLDVVRASAERLQLQVTRPATWLANDPGAPPRG